MYGSGAKLGGRYRLDKRIGVGGMGEVWRGTDEVLGRTVAVKVMRRELVDTPGFAERFLAEARTMATIRHPGVVTVHDFHSDPSGAYLVMEHVDGEALSGTLHRLGRLGLTRTMELVAQGADALQAAHDRGVVHRDIKPANLLLAANDTLVLTDFGIARSAAAAPVTATGEVLGTPSYLSPEQVLGQPATARSDVYALGVVAYECLAGQRPFDGDGPFEIAMKRVREPPRTLPVELPSAIREVVQRALAVDPVRRWQSAAEMAAAARRAAAGADAAPPPGPAQPPTAAQPPPGAGTAAPPGAGTAAPPVQPSPAPPPELPPAARRPGPPTLPEPRPGQPFPTQWRPMPVPAPARPPTVLAAAVLLRVAAAGFGLYFLAWLGAYEEIRGVYEGVYAGTDLADAAGLFVGYGVVAAAGFLLLSLILLLLARLNSRASRAARVWTFVIAVPGVCCFCCADPSLLSAIVDTAAETGRELPTIREAALPAWFGPVASGSILVSVAALLVALILLTVPPSNHFFRPPPAVVYYPYHP